MTARINPQPGMSMTLRVIETLSTTPINGIPASNTRNSSEIRHRTRGGSGPEAPIAAATAKESNLSGATNVTSVRVDISAARSAGR